MDWKLPEKATLVVPPTSGALPFSCGSCTRMGRYIDTRVRNTDNRLFISHTLSLLSDPSDSALTEQTITLHSSLFILHFLLRCVIHMNIRRLSTDVSLIIDWLLQDPYSPFPSSELYNMLTKENYRLPKPGKCSRKVIFWFDCCIVILWEMPWW